MDNILKHNTRVRISQRNDKYAGAEGAYLGPIPIIDMDSNGESPTSLGHVELDNGDKVTIPIDELIPL